MQFSSSEETKEHSCTAQYHMETRLAGGCARTRTFSSVRQVKWYSQLTAAPITHPFPPGPVERLAASSDDSPPRAWQPCRAGSAGCTAVADRAA